MTQTQENGEKPHFEPNLGPLSRNSGRQIFFKNMGLSVARYYCQISLCTISDKTNEPILRKINGGRTYGQTGGRTRVIS